MINEEFIIGSLIGFIGVVLFTNAASIFILLRAKRHWLAVGAAFLVAASLVWINWLVKVLVLIRFG